jgi:hypothetical protein
MMTIGALEDCGSELDGPQFPLPPFAAPGGRITVKKLGRRGSKIGRKSGCRSARPATTVIDLQFAEA